jgi:hypothetical protein
MSQFHCGRLDEDDNPELHKDVPTSAPYTDEEGLLLGLWRYGIAASCWVSFWLRGSLPGVPIESHIKLDCKYLPLMLGEQASEWLPASGSPCY